MTYKHINLNAADVHVILDGSKTCKGCNLNQSGHSFLHNLEERL